MVFPDRIRTTWVLTALFVAVVGIDEGWHLVPGNGHVVVYPGGYSFFLGAADANGETVPYQPPAGIVPNVPSVRGPEGCPICMVSGQARVGVQQVSGVVPWDLGLPAPDVVERLGSLQSLRRVRVRAPPLELA